MIIETLNLSNFRNHKNLSLNFDSKINLIIGPNGAGKTNILEAIYLMSTGKSFKANYDWEMIYNPKITNTTFKIENDFLINPAKVSGYVQNLDRDKIEITIIKNNQGENVSHKIYKVNGLGKKITQSQNFLKTVLFIPQNLDLFTGPPSLRRKFLDDLIFNIDQKYKNEHNIYTKSLKQRNKILEKINKTSKGYDELPFWTEKIISSGLYIQQKRREIIEHLNQSINEVFCKISNEKNHITIYYKQNQINEERVKSHLDTEIKAKTTLVGPHRDDFHVLINNYQAGLFGSRGQQRALILALKILELNIIERITKTKPILLLDDIFSEFDQNHQNSLFSCAQENQTVITTTKLPIQAPTLYKTTPFFQISLTTNSR